MSKRGSASHERASAGALCEAEKMPALSMQPFVSIIIPLADAHVELLPRALASVDAQTVADTNVIVVNDGALRREKLEQQIWQATPRAVQLPETRGRKGASRARNLGLERVNTPFVTFLDADDTLEPFALEVLLKSFVLHPEAAYAYGDHYNVHADGSKQYITMPRYDQRAVFRQNLHTVTALHLTKNLRAVGGFDETVRGWEDWDLNLRLALAGYCGAKVSFPVLNYHVALGQNRERDQNTPKLYDEILERYRQSLEGGQFMACQGCGSDAQQTAQQALAALGMTPPTGKVLLEYVGLNTGTIAYTANGRTYRGANDDLNKFVWVEPQDVQVLLGKGPWQIAPQPSNAPSSTPTVAQARRVEVNPLSLAPNEIQTSIAPIESPADTTKTATPKKRTPRKASQRKPHGNTAMGGLQTNAG